MPSQLSKRKEKIKKTKPESWEKVTASELRGIRGVCLDIDDTLSTDGKLTPEAFAALSDLKQAGFKVVPVTGRPAGWCDHIARFWPVDAVVGENGAFTFFMQEGKRKRLDTPAGQPNDSERMKRLKEKIVQRFPHAQWASDQKYREFDLAIDICEDVPLWREEDIYSLLNLCKVEGAHAKLSSIHVNVWFGEYDKRKGFECWLKSQSKLPQTDQWLYIGDSPNDEPMFASFHFSVGVANLKKYFGRI